MAECLRCGCHMKDDTAQQRAQRGRDLWGCQECQAAKKTTIKTAYGICVPHQGELDDEFRPLDKRGELYRPGIRLCNYSDCINLDHIKGAATTDGHKACTQCAESKPLDAYGIDRKKRDGLNVECKTCRAKRG